MSGAIKQCIKYTVSASVNRQNCSREKLIKLGIKKGTFSKTGRLNGKKRPRFRYETISIVPLTGRVSLGKDVKPVTKKKKQKNKTTTAPKLEFFSLAHTLNV